MQVTGSSRQVVQASAALTRHARVRVPARAMQLKRLQALPAWAALQGAEGSEDLWQQLISAIDMQLALTCVVLFFGATAAGLLPLLVTIPEQQVRAHSATAMIQHYGRPAGKANP